MAWFFKSFCPGSRVRGKDAQRFLQWIVESEDTGQQQEGQEGQESEPKLEKVESKR